ncbi:hypothetical protein B296_00026501 [Ensete ventricosum]|uniref:Uncharacterized protein n=1 Tax=Ensete ventricosum TaxID=4639 RepID=A0A426YY00_ENSVE|nr:hypothetical protein B296_00026501 [Ensete ventricosum]
MTLWQLNRHYARSIEVAPSVSGCRMMWSGELALGSGVARGDRFGPLSIISFFPLGKGISRALGKALSACRRYCALRESTESEKRVPSLGRLGMEALGSSVRHPAMTYGVPDMTSGGKRCLLTPGREGSGSTQRMGISGCTVWGAVVGVPMGALAVEYVGR